MVSHTGGVVLALQLSAEEARRCLDQLGLQLSAGHLTNIVSLHYASPPSTVSSRFTILHLTWLP